MDRWINRWTDGQIDGQMDRQMDRWIDRWTNIYVHRWTLDRQIEIKNRWKDRYDIWTDRYIDGQIYKMDRQEDRYLPVVDQVLARD